MNCGVRRFIWKTKGSVLPVVLIIIALSKGAEVPDEERETLYTPADPITNLNKTTFADGIYGQKKAFIVEFYSSWCGHCIDFAPTYVKFAKSVKTWSDVVSVTAVNCALEANTDLCAEHGIEAYPTLKYFQFHPESKSDTVSLSEQATTPETIAKYLARAILLNWQNETALNGNGSSAMQTLWPDFNTINETETQMSALFGKMDAKGGKILALVLEHANDTSISTQIILDFSKIHQVYIRKWLGSSLTEQFGKKITFPGLVLYNMGEKSPVFISDKPMSRVDIGLKIGHYLAPDVPQPRKTETSGNKDHLNTGSNATTLLSSNTSLSGAGSPQFSQMDHSGDSIGQDLLHGLDFLLRREVGSKPSIFGTKLNALSKFIRLLLQYFPSSSSVQNVLTELHEYIVANAHSGGFTGRDWAAKYASLLDQNGNFTQNLTWNICKSSDPVKYTLRGYPCSLWLMFHTLTARAYEHNIANLKFRPFQVLSDIKDFVINFFGCRECVNNFRRESEKLAYEVSEPKDVVLWLWRVHNRVNNRLRNRTIEDPLNPKVPFPPSNQCPSCMKGSDWNEDTVLDYLILRYARISGLGPNSPSQPIPSNSITTLKNTTSFSKTVDSKPLPIAQPDIGYQSKRVANSQKYGISQDRVPSTTIYKDGTAFTWLDRYVCFTLWFVTIVVVAILYVFYRYHRRRLRPKFQKLLHGGRDYNV